MCKFSETKAILTSPENSSLHIFGISELNRNHINCQLVLILMDFKHRFAKIMTVMAVGELLFMSGMESMLNAELI